MGPGCACYHAGMSAEVEELVQQVAGPLARLMPGLNAVGVRPSPEQRIVGLVCGRGGPARTGAHVVGSHTAAAAVGIVGAGAMQD